MTATTRTGLIAVGIVFGGFVLLAIGGWLLFHTPSITSLANEPIDGIYERKDFERLIEGKSRDEVIRLIGKPDTIEREPANVYEDFIYKKKTRHADAKQTDAITKVLLMKGRCIGVTYKLDTSE